MIKKNELSNPKSCLNKAADDEPLFVIRAKDLSSSTAVRRWAEMNEETLSKEKYDEAMDLADRMEKWQDLNKGKVKLPD